MVEHLETQQGRGGELRARATVYIQHVRTSLPWNNTCAHNSFQYTHNKQTTITTKDPIVYKGPL